MTLIDKAEALLPCPFCGGVARKWQDPSHSAAWFIGCDDGDTDCFGSIHWAETEAEAIAAWNRRAALPARGVGVEAVPVPDLVAEAGKMAERLDAASKNLRDFYVIGAVELIPAYTMEDAARTIRALIAQNTAQAAQIATKQARIDTLHEALDAEEARAALEGKANE